MKTVIETQTWLSSVRDVGLSDEDKKEMIDTIAAEPSNGEMIVGTGGCIKRRFAGRGKGKSGGYRTVHYNGADDIPVLMLVLIDKGDRENIDQGERNELRKLAQAYEEKYRAQVAANIEKMKKKGA